MSVYDLALATGWQASSPEKNLRTMFVLKFDSQVKFLLLEEKEKFSNSPKPSSLRNQIKSLQEACGFSPRKDYTDTPDDIEEV